MINQDENWRPVNCYEGLYEVSDLGNVRSLERKCKVRGGSMRLRNGTVLTKIMNKGYCTVPLCKDGKMKKMQIHRLVALAFISNPDNKPQVNHINGDKSDNRLANLEWCTRSENQRHAVSIGLKGGHPNKRKIGAARRIVDNVTGIIYMTPKLLAKELGVTERTYYRWREGKGSGSGRFSEL